VISGFAVALFVTQRLLEIQLADLVSFANVMVVFSCFILSFSAAQTISFWKIVPRKALIFEIVSTIGFMGCAVYFFSEPINFPAWVFALITIFSLIGGMFLGLVVSRLKKKHPSKTLMGALLSSFQSLGE
jgi:hypothetical protein